MAFDSAYLRSKNSIMLFKACFSPVYSAVSIKNQSLVPVSCPKTIDKVLPEFLTWTERIAGTMT